MIALRSSAADPVMGSIHAAMFSSGEHAPVHQGMGRVMGTTARVTTVGGPKELPEVLMGALEGLNLLWSRFLDSSELSRLNNQPGRSLSVSTETLELISHMFRGYRDTRGAFDPTILPALISQGYESSLVTPSLTTTVPKTARLRGDLSQVVIDSSGVTLPVGTTLDSGGVGKGLAADLVSKRAIDEGALGVLVEVGGDLRVRGVSPRGDSWRLAIEHPTQPDTRLSVVELSDHGLATSTVTKRRFEVNGQPTHHIINPETLHSTDSDTVQASVIASSAAEAEMWTKVAFVRGSAALLTEASSRGFEAACWLTSDEWVTTPGWKDADA